MPNDFDAIRALYFQGVLSLRKKDSAQARAYFSKAETIARARLKDAGITNIDVEQTSPMLEIRWGGVDENHDTRWADLHFRTHLALGRLAAAQETWKQANVHDRYVLPGHPTFFEASRARAVVFDRLRQPRMGAASLVSIGQASGVTGPGLKQSMWRAELLGRGEAYHASQEAYAHIDRHTQQISTKLSDSNRQNSTPQQKLRWLAPDLGLQFSDLLVEINALAKTVGRLEHEVKVSLNHAKMSFQKDLRAVEIAELEHRLREIKLGIRDETIWASIQRQLKRLGNDIKRLTLQNNQLRSHHCVFALQLLNELSSSTSEHINEFAAVQTTKGDAAKQVESATQGLLKTLETQSGLGRLNIFVWKKEAVGRKIAQTIQQNRRAVDWIESEAPSVSPAQR